MKDFLDFPTTLGLAYCLIVIALGVYALVPSHRGFRSALAPFVPLLALGILGVILLQQAWYAK